MNCPNPMCKYGKDERCQNPRHKFENVGKVYRKKTKQLMRPYIPGEDLRKVSVAPGEKPEEGGMIAIDAQGSQWYVSKKFFDENYEEA